jgi:hypothetical protein
LITIIGITQADEVWHRLRSETDRELSAALICLLTAALAANARPQSSTNLKVAGSGCRLGHIYGSS